MSQHHGTQSFPAPCIVDEGIVINQDDIKRLLVDLCYVHYIYTVDKQVNSKGRGLIQEIFSDSHQSTLVANGKIYINLKSFDYLQLSRSADELAHFDLIQDNCQLRLIPVAPMPKAGIHRDLDDETIEAMVTEALAARLDVQFDDEF